MPNNPNTQSLTGKIAIVTGAARGIGAASAIALADAGAHVLINDILQPNEVIAAIVSRGGSASPAVADVTDRRAVEEIVAAAR